MLKPTIQFGIKKSIKKVLKKDVFLKNICVSLNLCLELMILSFVAKVCTRFWLINMHLNQICIFCQTRPGSNSDSSDKSANLKAPLERKKYEKDITDQHDLRTIRIFRDFLKTVSYGEKRGKIRIFQKIVIIDIFLISFLRRNCCPW